MDRLPAREVALVALEVAERERRRQLGHAQVHAEAPRVGHARASPVETEATEASLDIRVASGDQRALVRGERLRRAGAEDFRVSVGPDGPTDVTRAERVRGGGHA